MKVSNKRLFRLISLAVLLALLLALVPTSIGTQVAQVDPDQSPTILNASVEPLKVQPGDTFKAEVENLEELKLKEIEPDKFAFISLSGDLIEIGEEKHSPPQPYLKLNKWDGEVSLKVDVPYGKNGEKSLAQNRLRWANHKYDVEFYPREPEEIEENGYKFTINEEGGVEFDVILKEKPESNIFEFPIESKGLKFYYQPELTQQEKDEGAFRPENVIGSYAVYHETQDKFFKTKEEAEKYKTGKAFHIYRPKVKDAQGNEIWGKLDIDQKKGILAITIDQEWLNKAVYPVRIDPNFGYTNMGSSWGSTGVSANDLFGSLFTSPSDAGTANSLTLGGGKDQSGSTSAKGVIVLHSNLNIITNGVTDPVNGVTYGGPNWWTASFSAPKPSLSPNTEYVLMFIAPADIAGRYDTGAANQGHTDTSNSYTTPSNPTDATHNTRKYSIYCTYTSAAIQAPTVTTQAVTSVEETTATGHGNITNTGGENPTRRIQWGTTTSYGNSSSAGVGGTGAYSCSMTGLGPGILYHCRAYATNSGGTGYGGDVTFTTKPNPPTGLSATAISQTQIDVSWTKGSGAETTMVRRKIGSYPTSVSDGNQAYSGTGSSFNDTSLSCGTHYYYRAWSYKTGAPNSGYSDSYSQADASTNACTGAPTVTTQAVTSVEETTATGNGNITNTGGENCDKRGVCWNTTGSPTVADSKSEETGSFTTGAFTRPITGLSPGTKYYVKAYAHNSSGYGYGSQVDFTTKPNPPTGLSATAISQTRIDVSWTKGSGAETTMVRRKIGSYPTSVSDGNQAYSGTGSSFNDTSLSCGTHYYYRAWSYKTGAPNSGYSDSYSQADASTNACTGAPPNNPDSLGPTQYVDGSCGTDNTPTLEFTQSDPDGGDTVKYRIQIDNDFDFSSPVVDFTSALLAQGTVNFTVGQAIDGGSYTAGSENQTLADGSYYWQVMSTDNHGASSGWTVARGGDAAFNIKASADDFVTKSTNPGDYTADAKNEADTEVIKSGAGTPDITIAKYTSSPCGADPSGFNVGGHYIDVYLNNTTSVTQIEIRYYYTDADISGLVESSLRMYYCSGGVWAQCSLTGVNTTDIPPTYSGYIWAKMTPATTPDLNYLLGSSFGGMGSSVSPPPGGGGGEGGGPLFIKVDREGTISKFKINMSGMLLEPLVVIEPDSHFTLKVNRYTRIFKSGDELADKIEIGKVDEPPPLPEGFRIVGNAYEFGASRIYFSQPVKLTFNFSPNELPERTEYVFLARYTPEKGWEELESEIQEDVAEGLFSLTTSVEHFSIFALLAKISPPPPPAFEFSSLSISPGQATIGETVTIAVKVTNTGGTKVSYSLKLKIDGIVKAVREIDLDPQESKTVSFELTDLSLGAHQVEIADLTGELSVVPPPPPPPPAEPEPAKPINWWLIGGILGGIALVVFVVFRVLFRFER